ncbi:nSTAND1 domain-containing NTPase [Fodinicurvata halophila]|uniref:nSTAND1 domain-containing NTPase n=1 Tax=Fodinicurvata halophila TaxID=1419723 RepID=UPI0036408B47
MTQDTRSPYPGLRSYESDESDLFFGREGCVDDMLEKLSTTRFLAVLGTSGSGKSSLVRTGLLDALELGFLPGRTSEWVVADMHPGDRPMHNLARTLVELDGVEHNDIELSLMRSFVNRGPRSLMQWCDDFGLKDDQNLLLIVDQFEELFRYRDYAGREEAEAFVALLLESARSDPRIHIVITMRSEFLGACAMMPGLAEQINTGLYLTRRMNRGECEQAIEGPSHVLGFEVEPRLVSEILNDMASLAPWDRDDALTSLEQLSRRADQLPLMQHVLNRLYERARSAGGPIVLTFEDYKVIGRLRGAIDAHAEEILSSLDEEARAAAEPVFRALVTGTNLSNALREPRRFRELVEVAGGNAAATTRLIDAFRAQGCSFLRPPPACRWNQRPSSTWATKA